MSFDKKEPLCVVRFPDDDYSDTYEVVKKKDLLKYEETYHYKNLREKEASLEKVRSQRAEIEKDIRDKVVKSLATRMMLNSIFHENGKFTQVGVALGQEIRKLADSTTVKELSTG